MMRPGLGFTILGQRITRPNHAGMGVSLRLLHPEIKTKVKAALDIIVSEPGAGESRQDALKGLNSFGPGRFRILYRIGSKRVIEIIALGPRKTIYQETDRLLKKTPPERNRARDSDQGEASR